MQKVIKKAQSAARKLLDIKKIKGFYPSGHSSEELNCNSLFLGTTGIAYFFLHLLHKNKRPMFNAMLPEVFGLKIDVPNQTKFLRLKKNIVIQQWVKRDFPKSYNYLSDIKDYPVDKLDIKMTDDEKSIARYEMQRNQMFRSIENFALLFKFYQHSNQRDYNLSSIISLSPFCKLFKVQFQQENLIDQSNTDLTSYFLVQNLPKMQREFRLDYFTFSLLSHFANDELPLFDQIELLKNTFESSKKNDLRDLVVSQTNLFLKQSIVVVKDPQK